jgi:hypothetical protein
LRSPLLDIGQALHAVRPALEQDLPLLVPVGVALLLFPQLLLARFAGVLPTPDTSSMDLPTGVIIGLSAVALAGLLFQLFLTMETLRARPGATVGRLLMDASRLLPASIVVSLCQALAVVPAAVLVSAGKPALALPGFLLALVGGWVVVRLMLAVPVLVVEGGGPLRAIGRSWTLTAGHSLRLCAMFLILMAGFLLFLLVFAGLGSAIASVSTLLIGEPASGWGIGRWTAEFLNAGASSLLSASLAVFVALVYRLLAARA